MALFLTVHDIEVGFSQSPRTVTLQAEAISSATAWHWKILSVPEGSVARVGQHQDFMDGVATVQNPQLEIDGGLAGLYVLRCVATLDGAGDTPPVGCYIRVSPICDGSDSDDPLDRGILEETKKRAAFEERRQAMTAARRQR